MATENGSQQLARKQGQRGRKENGIAIETDKGNWNKDLLIAKESNGQDTGNGQQQRALSGITRPHPSPTPSNPLAPPPRPHACQPPPPHPVHPLLSTHLTPPGTHPRSQPSYQDTVTSQPNPATNLIQHAAAMQDSQQAICASEMEEMTLIYPRQVTEGSAGLG
jgi:hypothetical protein